MEDDKPTTKRYTAGFVPDDYVRPEMGVWETPDWVQQATFQPDGVRTGSDGRLLTEGCTGFGG